MFEVLVGFLRNKRDAKVSGCKEPTDSRQGQHGKESFAKQPAIWSGKSQCRTQQYHPDRNLQYA